jgi:PAS domain-containing protein
MKGSVIMFLKKQDFSSYQWHFTSLIFIIAFAGIFFKVLFISQNSGSFTDISELTIETVQAFTLVIMFRYFLWRNRLIPLPQFSTNEGRILPIMSIYPSHFVSDISESFNYFKKKTNKKKIPFSEQQEFLSCLLDKIDKSIVVLDRFNEIIYCNKLARHFFGIRENEQGIYKKGN